MNPIELLSEIQDKMEQCEIGIQFEEDNKTPRIQHAHVWSFFRSVQWILYDLPEAE